MDEMLDQTQSQEIAFSGDNNKEDVFKFDPVKEETPAESQPAKETEETSSPSSEPKEEVVEEQRVPYSRFKSKVDELEQRDSIIEQLEARLSSLEASRVESKPLEDLEVPREWVELYGDSDVSKRAFKIQTEREQKLQEQAVQKAIEALKGEAKQEADQIAKNEEVLDDNLASLQESLGKKLTAAQEEEILSIVDEFSPTGADGKYLSMFPFDKAYEIYELRNQKQGQKTIKARHQVAELTGNASEGEVDSQGSDFKRGWDNWREAL